jgi:hypothetical protein
MGLCREWTVGKERRVWGVGEGVEGAFKNESPLIDSFQPVQ